MAGGAETLYSDDVFQTVVRTGTGSTATITTGFQPDLVWSKSRSAGGHVLQDAARGVTQSLDTSSTAAQTTGNSDAVTAFTSTGFTLGANNAVNQSGVANTHWAAKKAPKFFDCGTYTGNFGTAGNFQTISHSLGVAPGMVVVKSLSTGDWFVWHIGFSTSSYIRLNSTSAVTGPYDPSTQLDWAPTASSFKVSSFLDLNNTGQQFVWYAFAHDASTDGIIQCGNFTGDSGGKATVTLGWEPQFVLLKTVTFTDSWYTFDNMRGLGILGNRVSLSANSSGAEVSTTSGPRLGVTSNGFTLDSINASETLVYLAIRRPNKPPTSGTQVYNAIARTGTNSNELVNAGIGAPVDCVFVSNRNNGGGTPVGKAMVATRLTGIGALRTNDINAEYTAGTAFFQTNPWDNMVGVGISGGNTATNDSASTFINHFFRRAPGVFDVVCFNGGASSVSHGLGVQPELVIYKCRSGSEAWLAGSIHQWSSAVGNNAQYNLKVNATNGLISDQGFSTSGSLNFTDIFTSSAVTLTPNSGGTSWNRTGQTYVMYLFATKAGISKVGSYTGNGSSQTINCGFSAGARFVLIKRTDSTGDWYVWDTVRGIVSANDPHLSLNTTAAEVTTNDSIDPDSTGFIVNQLAATNINVNAATYIYLAFA